MNFTILLRNLVDKIYWKYQTQSVFLIDLEKQKYFLDALPEPKDLFERAYFQYKCQMTKLATGFIVGQNAAALLFLAIYYIKFIVLQKSVSQQPRKNSAIFLDENLPIQVIPDVLKAEFSEIISVVFGRETRLTRIERSFLASLIMRYWSSPYFILKCVLKVSMYCTQIEQFEPRAIITSCEFSFTSSVLTEYCRLRGVEHINVMHGEKLFNFRDSFAEFDRYYVWDEHYVNLLTDLRMSREQFRVAVPDILDLDSRREGMVAYTYYLAGEKLEELQAIKDTLAILGVADTEICIRYHPRYSDEYEIRQIFSGFQIENPQEISLSASFSKTKYVISLYSTVLFQAYLNGKEVLIDDVSDAPKYKKLKGLRYIMLEKPYQRLSNF